MNTHGLWGLVLAAFLVASCATARKKGDRAFESGDYDRALSHYERVIDRGTKEWEVYFRAARAATHAGDFSRAERYYGRALRNGGGTDVARKFAEFYLKTSNYAKAVRLLQFLLESGVEKQPVYNNLGTALMYAGAPIDAESYLLVAQQMEPEDPIPYVNLGVLYDRYLHRPRLAYGFYRCYAELAERGSQNEKVRSRLSALASRLSGGGSGVECGAAYRPESGDDPEKLRSQLEELKSGGEASDGSSASEGEQGEESARREPIDLKFKGVQRERSADREPEGETDAGTDSDAGPTIERGAERPARPEPKSGASGEDSDPKAALERARDAWEEENYEEVVDAISGVAVGELNVDAMRIFGRSLAEIGENERAQRWLEWVVERKPDPETVAALLEVYRRLDRDEKRRSLCERFRERDEYEETTSSCPESEAREELENEEKMRRIREKLRKKRQRE